MRMGRLILICALIMLTNTCPLPLPCECEKPSDRPGVNIINCKQRNLQTIPTINASTEYYEELTLVGNTIHSIPSAAFNGLLVKRISIQDNPISQISEDAFSGVETTLEELFLHGDKVNAALPAPWSALDNLTLLTMLELSHFNIGTLENSTVLLPFRNLKKLVITSSQLHYISPRMFEPVNETLRELVLSSNIFQSLPVGALRSLTQLKKLTMETNRIQGIGNDAFSANTLLDELNLLQNEISTLEPGCFNQIENSLTYLGLNLNRLTANQLSPLSNLRAITQLNLGYNPLSTIPPGIFTNMHNLNFLNLQQAQIQTLSANTFTGLGSSMFHLILSENHLTHIDPGTFSAMTALLELHLDSQTETLVLVPGVFRGLENSLDTLYLDKTGFGSQASWDAIGDLKNLHLLNLAKNQLSDIPDFAFTNMSELSTLHLDDNKLANITQEQFHGLRDSLTKLHLERNSIEFFDHCVITNFSRLLPEFTKLDGNPLACDCKLKWLSKWVEKRLSESNDPFLPLLILWTCADGRIFREIEPESLVCSSNYTEPECADYYTTTTSSTTTTTTEPATTTTTTTQPTTTQPTVIIELQVTNRSRSIIKLAWNISHPAEIDYFQFQYEDISEGNRQGTGQIHRLSRHYELRSLAEGKTYEICLFVYYKNLQPKSDSKCLTTDTIDMSNPAPARDGAMNGEEIGIIVGAILGGVFLILIIIAITFILIRNRRQENVYDKPVEPAPWSRAGKPQVGYDSKRFIKQKKPGNNDHHIKEIRHVQGENPSNLQRTSGGSYQYLDETVRPQVNGAPIPPIGLNNAPYPPQKPHGKGLDTSDFYHKYYEIALDGMETHI